MLPAAKLHTKILTRQAKPGGYKVYRAGLEWDLTDPIVIESPEDFKSTPRWRDKLSPYRHQVSNLITFCRRLPVTLLADDVGLGKTISAGLVMSELIVRSRLSKVLIVCPKLLCPQWQQELAEKFDIDSEIATGRALLEADPEGIGAVITTYNSARLYLDRLPEDRFQMLILDEAHKLRNLYGVPNPPQVAKRFQKALEDQRFRYVLMLTATPIQNRLWDIYSLVDLLTSARGHENPFGSPGMFARRFIADEREKARQLRMEASEEFRSIVYGYMSRVRRGDAGLSFPDRKVQMHQVMPSLAELQLISVIAKPIQKMNRLAQISILKALASSPEALRAQLNNMAKNGTAPVELAAAVRGIVETMPLTSKLKGLAVLIEQLKKQNPERWRLIVFTTLRETQTTIQNFLERQGLTVGIINGDSGQRNQETIVRFRQNPPRYRVIVSTEAGSEGVNLQVANVLVNYDLPWNPMIVEQRIGRVQRLASEYKHVSVFNITLRGTFEDFIVGRLMEKLQMAANAIGDIDALLQGSDVADGEEDGADKFEDRILKLVLDALAGKNVEEAVRLDTQSIEDAKRALEEANIDEMLGDSGGNGYVGPKAPSLPSISRSMNARDFALMALSIEGARVTEEGPGVYFVEGTDLRERICFDVRPDDERQLVLYASHTPPFQRLVKRIVTSGVHDVRDADANLDLVSESGKIAAKWVETLGAKLNQAAVGSVTRAFSGTALLRVRATVAHDSYEQLITCSCKPEDHCHTTEGDRGLGPVERIVRDPTSLGVDVVKLQETGERDESISEFARFYEERREHEIASAGSDARKRKKLDDDFTPRIDMILVGLEGEVGRDVAVRARYSYAGGGDYESEITVRPMTNEIVRTPETDLCARAGHYVPKECLGECVVSGAKVLQHLLVTSEFSNRAAQPEFIERCELSGKRALVDELDESVITGRRVASVLLKQSSVSGKRAEPEHFGVCAFTNAHVLSSELGVSDISGKPHRLDQRVRSEVSGRTGHAQEFTTCHETRQMIARDEAETCDISGRSVRSGVLEACAVSGKRALPSLLATCQASGARVLSDRLVSSNVSNARLLKERAVQSTAGQFCLPAEAEVCLWSGRKVHPDDLRTCALTGLRIHADYITPQSPPRLRPLVEMLDGMRHNTDQDEVWDRVAQRLTRTLKSGKCRIEAATLSPSKQRLATCAESKTMLGLRVHQVGAVYDLVDDAIIGRLAEGKRKEGRWLAG
jgi:superfamily II DNA or RNA helicase